MAIVKMPSCFIQMYLKVKLVRLTGYAGSPMDIPEGMENKVMHVSLRFEENEIMGCDDLQATQMLLPIAQ
jgi:uncharacterized glyoxalase superfamily protein PhnB